MRCVTTAHPPPAHTAGMDTATTTAPLAVARLTHAMTYDSPTRLVEWLTRSGERGYAG
jgi:hypothetical protein